MRRILIASMACLALGVAACTTLDLKESLPRTCYLINKAHAAFLIVTTTGDVSQKNIDREAVAYAGIKAVCDNPTSVTPDNALVLAAQAYATITLALRDAKRSN
ncbi:cell wall anchor protein [Phyllobacterium sp. LjRoot231]|uniref:cell wall anchor protein n=1 Tax=Phyllobacterium sp. LjRoot231 TaxID=3342289 RepID=UPI003ECD39D9